MLRPFDRSRVRPLLVSGLLLLLGLAPCASASSSPVTAEARAETPANDDFANAELIEGASGTVGGAFDGATTEPGEPDHGGFEHPGSVWYRWFAPTSMRVTFVLDCGGVIAAYTGSTVTTLTEVAAGHNHLRFNNLMPARVGFDAVTGTEYRIAAAGCGGALRLTWRAGPQNDDFDDAAVLSGIRGVVVGSNSGATREVGEPLHAAGKVIPGGAIADGGVSVWHRWTAPETGHVLFETLDSRFDTALAVYRGAGVAELTRLARCNDILGVQGPSAVSFRAVAGRTYSIAVSGIAREVEGTAWLGMGRVSLRWHPGRVLRGTRQPDVINGTPASDLIVGRGGDDRLYGLSGRDLIVGDGGRDRLFGGPGADDLDARDRVHGNDAVYGGGGIDRARADRGDLVLGVP
jgi:RTX calcium-binding nonapeptide repeat (4 copies)